MSKTTNKFAPEVRERAVRMVADHERDYPSRWAAVVSIAEKIGCVPQTLHEWVKKAEVDSGKRAGVSTEVADKVKALEREVRELRRPTRFCASVSIFCSGGALPPVPAMIAFIDDHRDAYGGRARSAAFCRSPHPPTTSVSHRNGIRPAFRRERGRTRSLSPRSRAYSPRTSRSTVSARSGGR